MADVDEDTRPVTLLPVPPAISETAAASLIIRARTGGGGTARSVVIATALSTGYVTPEEQDELARWHRDHPEDTGVLAGLYGGPEAQLWHPTVTVAASPTPSPTASPNPSTAKLARLSRVINQTNRRTLTRLHAAATVALEEALRQVDVKLNVKARSAAKRAALLADGPVIPVKIAALGLTERDLLDKRFDTYRAYAVATLTVAERRKLAAAARAAGQNPDDVEAEYGVEIDRRADLAGAFLVAALTGLAISTLSGHTVEQPSETGPVPYSLARGALDITARGATPPPVDEGVGPGTLTGERPAGAGPTLVDQFLGGQTDTVGETTTRYTWVHDAPDKPFPPHEDVDGVTWLEGDDAPELAWDSGEFPFVDVLAVGDHDGCLCDLDVEIVAPEGTFGTGEAQAAGLVHLGYSPDQERDDHGRFGEGSGESGSNSGARDVSMREVMDNPKQLVDHTVSVADVKHRDETGTVRMDVHAANRLGETTMSPGMHGAGVRLVGILRADAFEGKTGDEWVQSVYGNAVFHVEGKFQ